ncbi:hypothetical protein BC828DRAFT_407999 [Blastocladiella britannica]|nr:hypothetical protein BC828DRAFT_407999 [Blastocladiella britannica]
MPARDNHSTAADPTVTAPVQEQTYECPGYGHRDPHMATKRRAKGRRFCLDCYNAYNRACHRARRQQLLESDMSTPTFECRGISNSDPHTADTKRRVKGHHYCMDCVNAYYRARRQHNSKVFQAAEKDAEKQAHRQQYPEAEELKRCNSRVLPTAEKDAIVACDSVEDSFMDCGIWVALPLAPYPTSSAYHQHQYMVITTMPVPPVIAPKPYPSPIAPAVMAVAAHIRNQRILARTSTMVSPDSRSHC